MDDIGLYKGKLNEALNIVPKMSQNEIQEAVSYWNNVALQFQNMVSTTSETGDENTESNNLTDINRDTAINDGGAVISDQSCDMNHPLGHLPSSQLQVALNDDNPIPDGASDPSIWKTTVAIAPQSSMSTLLSTTAQDLPHSGTLMFPEESSSIKHLPPGGITPQPAIEYNNIILSGSVETSANVASEIGNGQFDRGPAKGTAGAVLQPNTSSFITNTAPQSGLTDSSPLLHSESHLHSSAIQFQNDQSLMRTAASQMEDDICASNTNSNLCQSTSVLDPLYDRPDFVDSYTHSNRPLQEIQTFEPSADVHNHNLSSQEISYPDQDSNLTQMRSSYLNSNHYLANNFDQTNVHYSSSPIGNSANFNPYSLSATSSPIEDSFMEMEQIKRELIIDSEREDTTKSTCGVQNCDFELSSHPNNPTLRAMIFDNLGLQSQNQHTCEVCGKSGFSTKGNLKRHLKAHSGEKPFQCEFCDSRFTEKKSLKIHVRRHTGEKPYKCDVCGKEFSQTGVLQSHMSLHLNERKFECNKCNKAFRQRSQLKLHLMRHDGVKRLECQTCNAKFLTKGDLERHCRIHTGERPYRCTTCGKTFTRQQSLNEHMNRHNGQKPYYCKFCDRKFSEMSACYKHAKTHKRQEQSRQQYPGQMRQQ